MGKVDKKRLAFARAVADPTSPTFGNATRSYLAAVNPNVDEASATRGGVRYMGDDVVKREILRLGQQTRTVAALTPADYIEGCLDAEKMLLNLVKEGDARAAMAAAKYRELAGRAGGLILNRVVDATPTEKKRQDVRAILGEMRKAVATMEEIDKPNPLPQLASGGQEVVEAEFTVEDA